MGPFATFILAMTYFKEVLLVVVLIILAALLLRYVEHRGKRKDFQRVNDALLSMEADNQDLLVGMGDPAGVYGRFDAYTMPLTRRMLNEVETVPQVMYLDDYDDGLRGWK